MFTWEHTSTSWSKRVLHLEAPTSVNHTALLWGGRGTADTKDHQMLGGEKMTNYRWDWNDSKDSIAGLSCRMFCCNFSCQGGKKKKSGRKGNMNNLFQYSGVHHPMSSQPSVKAPITSRLEVSHERRRRPCLRIAVAGVRSTWGSVALILDFSSGCCRWCMRSATITTKTVIARLLGPFIPVFEIILSTHSDGSFGASLQPNDWSTIYSYSTEVLLFMYSRNTVQWRFAITFITHLLLV